MKPEQTENKTIELTDEEIFKAADTKYNRKKIENYNKPLRQNIDAHWLGFIDGAKWYREQLNKDNDISI